MDLLIKYIIALTNFYGVVSPEIVLAVYNQQNEHQVIEEDVQKYLLNPAEKLTAFGVVSKGGLFIQQSLFIGDDTLIRVINEKNDKPYYIPEKTELKSYLDPNYIEKNEYYDRLYQYLRKQLINISDDLLEEICEKFVFGVKDEVLNFGFIIRQLRSMGIFLEDCTNFQKIVELVADLGSNVRLWENNGFTRKELFENEISILLHHEVYEVNKETKVSSRLGDQQLKNGEKVRKLDDYRH